MQLALGGLMSSSVDASASDSPKRRERDIPGIGPKVVRNDLHWTAGPYAYIALAAFVVFRLPWLVERWMDVYDRRRGR
jgi:hypothetical protein